MENEEDIIKDEYPSGNHFLLRLEGLPFTPDDRQIIYVENTYDGDVNGFILQNYDRICESFKDEGYEFVYLPKLRDLTDERIRYNVPYLTSRHPGRIWNSCRILDFMLWQEVRYMIGPSLVVFNRNDGGSRLFEGWKIKDKCKDIDSFERLCQDICWGSGDSHNMASCLSKPFADIDMPCVGAVMPTEDSVKECACFSLAEETEPDIVDELIEDLQRSVKELQLKGITLAAIHDMIDKHEKVSRLLITNDYRIFLPDYNNLEIEMGDLPKALFFTFLNHPEGIVIKNISDYYNEIFNIYRQLKPNFKEEGLRVSVTKLTNPLGNGINENIARIRCAFVRKFDEHLAKNYIVTGKKGETYSIPLDRKLVEWEEED